VALSQDEYRRGGEPWILIGTGSRTARPIGANGFFSLMVERVESTTRYVAIHLRPQHRQSVDMGSF